MITGLLLIFASFNRSPERISPALTFEDDHVVVEGGGNWLGELLNDSQGGGHASGVSTTYERRVPGCNAFSKLLMGVMGGVNFLSFFLRGFRVWRASVLASLMFVVFLAGGCSTGGGGGGEQSPSPTNQETSAEPEVTPEPEGTPTVVEVEPPVKPEAMSSDGEGGAVAALEYFLDVLSYSFATRDTTLLDDISYEQCSFCANVDSEMGAMSNNEEHYRNVVWKLDEVLSVDVDREVAFTIKATFTVTTKFDAKKADGVVTTDGIFTVGHKNGEWELIEVSKP